MSPSPQDTSIPNATRNYSDSWRAIMQLVRSGYSWSGNERNCVFLNCTNTAGSDQIVPHFADVSAISGLDFPDDGRSLAVVDWDHDGDLDLWFRNRSAPRLRLMRNLTNEIDPNAQHVTLRLVGTTCNRDAIGARAQLVLNAVGSDGQLPKRPILVRSVRAGDAFLSQSSKWLHFGVPKGLAVAQVVVDWPGGHKEKFDGVVVGSRYEIKQGTGQAIRIDQRESVSLRPKPYAPLPQSAAARIVLPGRVMLPPVRVLRDGIESDLSFSTSKAPTLVTFWSSSCQNCREELTDIATHQSDFEQASLNVIAICLDGLDSPLGERLEGYHSEDTTKSHDTTIADRFMKDIRFPFLSTRSTRESIDLIRRFQELLFSKYPSFVVPLSFLVDEKGRVVCIYRGGFAHETFLHDRDMVDLDDASLRALAPPLVGSWVTEPATRSQFAEFVGARLMAYSPEAARQYLEAAKER